MILVTLVLLAGLSAIASWQLWHANRIFTGTSVSGLSVGGKTRAQALVHLHQSLSDSGIPAVMLQYDGQQWSLPAQAAAVDPDLSAAVNRAYLIERGADHNLLEKLGEQWQSAWQGYDIAPDRRYNERSLRTYLAAHGRR